MTVSYVKSIIERAKNSISLSSDTTYCEMITQKIQNLEYEICLDQETASLDALDDSQEITSHIEASVSDLDLSI